MTSRPSFTLSFRLAAFTLPALAFCTLLQAEERDPERNKAQQGQATPYAYRSFTFPANEPQFNTKLLEYTGEAWELVTSSGGQGFLFKRPIRAIESDLLKKVAGTWILTSLMENGTIMWPPPKNARDSKPATKSTFTLRFDGCRFQASRDQGKTCFQEGTIQYIAVSSSNANLLLVDLLITRDENAANQGFTVRAIFQVDASPKKLTVWSGGYGSDRPTTNIQTPTTSSTQIPAYSTYDPNQK